MPKVKQSIANKLNNFVRLYGEKVFSTDANILFCKLCAVRVLRLIEAKRTTHHMLLGEACSSSGSTFFEELCEAFICADIPLNKVSNPKLRAFLEKHTGKPIPHSSTLRKNYVSKCYQKTMKEIRLKVSGKKIWVRIDETMDSLGRYVANVVVGRMVEDGPGEQFLINCEQLEKVNFSTISKVFDRSLGLIYPNGIQHDNVLLLLTDAASYMVKAANSLQALYSKMVHVTCLAHALHRVAKELRSQFPEVDRLIGCIKKVFLKAPSRVATFKTEAPEVPLPPSPVVTRWGTWIEACNYYFENIKVVKRIIDMFDSSDAASIKLAQELLSDSELAGKLLYIKSNFGFLPGAITCLEKSGVKLVEQRDLVKKVASDLENVNGKVGKDVAKKIVLVLNKNKGFTTLSSIADVLSGEKFSLVDLPGDLEASDLIYFKYAPLVSVQVERSFSMYKALLADNRQSFCFENLQMIFIVHCNSELHKQHLNAKMCPTI